MNQLIIRDTTTITTVKVTTVYIPESETDARIARIEKQLADMQALLERLNRYAASDPEQVAFEAKYHAGRCYCVQCEERRQEVQA